MRKLATIAIAALLATSGTIAFAAANEDQGAAAKEEGPQVENDGEKIVCKTEKITGTRSKVRKICMSKAEWAALSDKTQKSMDDFSKTSGRAPAAANPLGGN